MGQSTDELRRDIEDTRADMSYTVDAIDPALLDLPHRHGGTPSADLVNLQQRIWRADAFVVVVPEYNHGYPAALPVIKDKLRPGGVLIIDNMLWGGRIFDEADQSADTRGVREFTRLISKDPDWIVTLVPIRDGLIVAYRK